MTHRLTWFEKLSFSLAGMGQNIIYNFMVSLVMFYYTDVALISAGTVGLILLVSRIWDAINDPIMGLIADRTHTKIGKLRPYLLAVPIPIAFLTVLAFAVPEWSVTEKALYALVTFNLWSMTYTVSDIPFWGLSVAITDNPKERLNLVTMVRIFCNIGMAIGILIPPILIGVLGGSTTVVEGITRADNANAYLWTAIIVGVVGSTLFLMAGLFNKERVIAPKGQSPEFSILLKNRPLLILQLSRVLGAFRMVIATVGLYFANKNLNDPTQYTILGGILIASMILSMFFAPALIKRFGKKWTYIYAQILGFIAHLMMFVLGYANLGLLFGLLFLAGVSLGISDVVTYSLTGDTVDYLEHRTGQRAEGLVFSLNTFSTKLQSALGLAFIGLVLAVVGYQGDAAVQTPAALNGIFALLSLFPAIACVLSILPMLLFDFTEHEHAKILSELHHH
jgi:GPH family glycoside/pentoside/hexuronide:cation symporter/probable glucitol transport protein GutA